MDRMIKQQATPQEIRIYLPPSETIPEQQPSNSLPLSDPKQPAIKLAPPAIDPNQPAIQIWPPAISPDQMNIQIKEPSNAPSLDSPIKLSPPVIKAPLYPFPRLSAPTEK
jgi:hypothetical protein